MTGKVVLTYKRKRQFSRSERSHDVSSENFKSDKSGFDRGKNSIAETRLQDSDKEFEVRHEHINNSEGESRTEVGSNDAPLKELSEDMALSIAPAPLKERDNLHKDHCTNFRDDPSYKRRLSLPLIAFSRRSKRKRDTDEPIVDSDLIKSSGACEKLPATSCSVELKDKGSLNMPSSFIGNLEKNSSEDIESSLISDPDIATSQIVEMDNRSQSPHGTAGESRSASAPIIQSRHVVAASSAEAEMNRSDDSSVTKRTPTNVSASRGIDCNLPPSPESDSHLRTRTLDVEEVCRDASGSTGMVNAEFPSLQLQGAENRTSTRPFVDKGKSVMDSPEVTYLQLFPMSRSNDTLQTTNDPQSRFPDLSLQSNGWPDVPARSREPLRDFARYAFGRPLQRTTLDDVLPIPRTTARFVHPYSTWLEDELDCLWIGVRRHGVGNWDAMLRDQRLRFFPQRTTSDLAERWLEEQSQLVQGLPASRFKSTVRPVNQRMMHSNLVDDSQLSLGYSFRYGMNKQRPYPSNFVNDHTNAQLQAPVLNPGAPFYCHYLVNDPFPVKESFPLWQREANQIPSRLNEPNQSAFSSIFGSNGPFPRPWMNKAWRS